MVQSCCNWSLFFSTDYADNEDLKLNIEQHNGQRRNKKEKEIE